MQHALDLDAVVAEAIASRTLAENVAIIEANQLTAMPVQTVADIERDPHWRARNLTVSVPNGHEHGADAQRLSAVLRDTRRDRMGRRRRSVRTMRPSSASWAWTPPISSGCAPQA